jgi:hypothetical protein
MMASQNSFMGTFSSATGETRDIEVIQPSNSTLFDRAVLLSISIGCLGTKKKVLTSAVESDADKSMLHVSKDILQSPILDEIRKYDSATRKWVADRALPSQFRSGVYLWPIALVLDADSFLRSRSDGRLNLIDRFMLAYNSARLEAQNKLGTLYNPNDYPSADKVRSLFVQSYQFIECNTPGQLRDLSPELFIQERDKAAQNWSNALDEARELLRGQLVGLVEHMKERMEPDAEGKPKKFKASLVANFNQFLELFDARNIASDSELQAIVEQCKQVLGNSTAEAIRDSQGLRERLAAGMESIKGALDGFVTTQGRSINLEADNSDTWGDI